MLETLFERQRQLMEKYHRIEEENVGHSVPTAPHVVVNNGSREVLYQHAGPLNLNDRASQLRLKDFFWRITEELGEAANTLKLKPWKSTPMLTDEVHYREEIIDALHFFIEMLILSGFDARSTLAMYLNKHAVNQFRQGSNY